MAKTPLTPEQKEHKKQIDDWQRAKNRVTSAWSFKKVKTYEDMLESAGFDRASCRQYFPAEQLEQLVTHQHINQFFEPYKQRLEYEFDWQTNGSPTVKLPADFTEYEGVSLNGKAEQVALPEITVDPFKEIAALKDDERLPHSDKQKCFLFPFQERAAKELYDGIVKHSHRGQLLRAAVGTGKTYIIGAVIRRLLDIKFAEGKTYSPWAFCYITRASIVEQTKRVLKESFGINTDIECQVINIEKLRSSFGDLMVRAETVVERGEEHIRWKWRNNVHPLVIFLDECQAVKNLDSQQSQILQKFNDINNPETFQIYFSATPFMRVCEAKCFAVSTRLTTKYGVATTPLSNDHWSDFARHVADPAEPEEYSPAAVERLMKHLDKYIVSVKGVRPQFHAHNNVQMIQFQSAAEREFYDKAWERYQTMKSKIEGYDLSASQSRFLILAQFTVFRRAAEMCRAPYFAKAMWDTVNNKGQAVCVAVNFKGTIRRVVDILVNDYNVSRDDISLIWGGGKTTPNKKQKVKRALVTNDLVMQILQEQGISLDDMNLADVEDYVDEEEDPTLRLGIQSLKERQREIDRYQNGTSRYAMFTFKAGGVGLSLHHTDEFTKEKCRRKKNGWVYTEDIPLIPTRQRICLLAPTFSAIELVQGLGRCPRLTSLSDTPQTVVFYSGTIEERVAQIVSIKLRCLRKVVRSRESWEDCIVGGVPQNDDKTLVPAADYDEDDAPDAGFIEEDEEGEE